MPDKAVEAKVEALFAQTSVRSAQHQKVLREWLSGLSDQYPGQSRTDAQIEQEEKGVFTLEPEIAGLGIPAQSLDEDEITRLDPLSHHEDASTAFLRERLLGKKAKGQKPAPVQRGTINLPGLEPGFQINRIRAGHVDPASPVAAAETSIHSAQVAPAEEVEHGEDDVGRSGVGKKKKAHKDMAIISTSQTSPEAGDIHDPNQILERPGADLVNSRDQNETDPDRASISKACTPAKRGFKRKQSKMKPKARSYLDDLLAEKEAKRQRKQTKG